MRTTEEAHVVRRHCWVLVWLDMADCGALR